jgi:hypothetical protein
MELQRFGCDSLVMPTDHFGPAIAARYDADEAAMVEQLRTKPGGADISVVVGE